GVRPSAGRRRGWRERLGYGQLILERADILEAQDDAGLAELLGARDVGGGVDRQDEGVMVAEEALPLRDVAHRALEALPHRAGAVGRGQAALAHVGEDGAAPVRDDQA